MPTCYDGRQIQWVQPSQALAHEVPPLELPRAILSAIQIPENEACRAWPSERGSETRDTHTNENVFIDRRLVAPNGCAGTTHCAPKGFQLAQHFMNHDTPVQIFCICGTTRLLPDRRKKKLSGDAPQALKLFRTSFLVLL